MKRTPDELKKFTDPGDDKDEETKGTEQTQETTGEAAGTTE